MGLLSNIFGKKEKQTAGLRSDWPWGLIIGPKPSLRTFSWSDIQQALEALYPDNNSFVILEQKDPADPNKRYWFIQSAFALAGPHKGKYIVGVGWGRDGKRGMLEQYFQRLDQVVPYFDQAYRGQLPDLSGFEDHSDMLF